MNLQRVSKAIAAASSAGIAAFGTAIASGVNPIVAVVAGLASAVGAFAITYWAPPNAPATGGTS